MVRRKPVFFAIDNIDFVEDTAFGQNSTHGTVIVVWREEDVAGQKLNPELAITKKWFPIDIDAQWEMLYQNLSELRMYRSTAQIRLMRQFNVMQKILKLGPMPHTFCKTSMIRAQT